MSDALARLRSVLAAYDASYPPDILDGDGGEPGVFALTAINPTTVPVDVWPLTFHVWGSGFQPGAQMKFGTVVASDTVYVSSTHLTYPDFQAAAALGVGAIPVTVLNPGDVESNAATFTITPPPVIALTELVPNTVASDTGWSHDFIAFGTGFDPQCEVVIDGHGADETAFYDSTSLTWGMDPASVGEGTHMITVRRGSQNTAALPFDITA